MGAVHLIWTGIGSLPCGRLTARSTCSRCSTGAIPTTTGPASRSRRLARGRPERSVSARLARHLLLRTPPRGRLLTSPRVKPRGPPDTLWRPRIWPIIRWALHGTEFVLSGPRPESRRQNGNVPGNLNSFRRRSGSSFSRRSRLRSSDSESCVVPGGASAQQAHREDRPDRYDEQPTARGRELTRETLGARAQHESSDTQGSTLKLYKSGKGAVQFPLGRPLPTDLIRRIVEFRVKENIRKASRSGRASADPQRAPNTLR
jgi:hypothetical protein